MILWPFYPRDQFLGVSQPMVDGNWLKSIFFLFLDHLPGFPNYTFLNFQKIFFSLHPNNYRSIGVYRFIGSIDNHNPKYYRSNVRCSKKHFALLSRNEDDYYFVYHNFYTLPYPANAAGCLQLKNYNIFS